MKRQLLKSLLLVACVAACARVAAAQEPCRLERAVAPDYGGVMLGMTPAELVRMFPGSEELPRAVAEGAGTKPVVASLGMLELGVRREQFADAAELLLTFLGGHLHRIDVRYRRPEPWKNVAEFSGYASRRLAVPTDAWGAVASDSGKQSRVLDCRGFSVVVRMDRAGPSTLSIVDTLAAGGDSGGANASAPATAPAPAKRHPRKGRGGTTLRPPTPPGAKEKPLEKED